MSTREARERMSEALDVADGVLDWLDDQGGTGSTGVQRSRAEALARQEPKNSETDPGGLHQPRGPQ